MGHSLTRDSSLTSRQLVTLHFCILIHISTFLMKAGLDLALGLQGSVSAITANIGGVYVTCLKYSTVSWHLISPLQQCRYENRYFNIPILQMMKLTWRHKLFKGTQPQTAELGNKARSHEHQGPWLSATSFTASSTMLPLSSLKRLQEEMCGPQWTYTWAFNYDFFFLKKEKKSSRSRSSG